ncbi:hypothetical protein CAF53_09110 [Sphingobium sp. LB126]|uniref:thiamine pyrophosphate-binding protein n=1 Tax=Sphingobium sp. LB126 TaxID=1983755 RepID=UPI000C20E822|nr:thiamine pyrophosphate-binding protein [Sphingobium sp. LB126]PJG48383.1 hypothetical protein CAF53_09110 [Sphingobium sp. LB126]
MRLYQALSKSLMDHGVTTMFGLIGDANLFMVDAYVKEFGGTYIAAANEIGAAVMALGYASGTGQLGVATVTHGPATTNTLTPLIEGVKGRIPLLLLCGDTDIADRDNVQDVSQRDLIVATGAGFEPLRSPKTALRDLSIAMHRAIVERRPIAFNMPVNFQWAEVDYEPERLTLPNVKGLVARGDELDNAAGIIAGARKPVILAGRGAMDAKAALVALGERIGAPLATTLKGHDLFKGERFNLGIFGTLSTPQAIDEIVASDCVVAFGASLNKFTSAQGSLLQGKRVVQIDADAAAIGRNWNPDAAVIGDAAAVAEEIRQLLDMAEIPPPGVRNPAVESGADKHPTDFKDISNDRTIDPRKVLLRLEEALPADRVVVTDAGRFVLDSWKRVSCPDPASYHLTTNFGSIGLGVPWAVGASYAAPGRPVLLLTGDGGFMHGGLNEFNSAVRHQRDLIVVVINDGGYGAEEVQFRARDLDPSSAFFEWPELADVAVALGGEGVTVRTAEDLEQAIAAIARRARPLLIDVKVDPMWLTDLSH